MIPIWLKVELCPPFVLEDKELDTINERTLKEKMTLGQLLHFRIVERADRCYRVYCRLAWIESEVLFETQRKEPREWSSMDRLLDYLQKTFGDTPIIFLRNFSEKDAYAIANPSFDPLE